MLSKCFLNTDQKAWGQDNLYEEQVPVVDHPLREELFS